MAWVSFTGDFDFSPAARKGMVTISYKAGMTANVTRECADLAVAAGRAERTTAPKAASSIEASVAKMEARTEKVRRAIAAAARVKPGENPES